MDDLDRRILTILRRDSRTAYTEIADRVGTSEGTVRNRVERLIDEGIIERFTVATRTGNVKAMVEVGRAYTAVEAPELTPASVVAAIREGRVSATVDDSLPYRLLRGFYRKVHERKRHLDRPEAATPGVGDPPGED